jgi:enamine deaminase RidA (YjgF/YER057c/UK114 family)
MLTGKVGGDVSIEQAQEGARLCVLQCLAAINEVLADPDGAGGSSGLDRVSRVVKLLGFVNSAPGFNQQHVVMDGASGLLLELFGDRGLHARSSVGMAELPMNIAVEVEMIVEVRG